MSEEAQEPSTERESETTKQPQVFISYSHDSDEHGQWILKLAERLVSCGVNVFLDQWDLGPGDDVVKYMRQSVTEANRVLMICTAEYVRKADEGKGGVGYEAMVVDGELVRDLGTNKFIPIIRQKAAEPNLPKSVNTRIYVNLSHGGNFEAQFEKLVRDIHQSPKTRKPTLGKNPFPTVFPINPAAEVAGKEQAPQPKAEIESAEVAYLTGLEVAKSGDFTAWRQLVRKVKGPLSARLNEWRRKYAGVGSMEYRALPEMVLQAATIYSPLISLALAGVESGQPRFINQTAMLDEFLRPKEWNAAGLTVVVSIPDALVFTYQALHGAVCLEIGELPLAIVLSRARVTRAHNYDGVIVHKDKELIGWPESFSHNATSAWMYLTSLFEKWPWLGQIFHSADEYRASLGAYYLALNVQELAVLVAAGRSGELDNPAVHLQVPVEWMRMPLEIRQGAYRRFTQSADEVRSIWRTLGVPDKAMAAAWPKWMEHAAKNIDGFDYPSVRGSPVQSVLFEDIRPET